MVVFWTAVRRAWIPRLAMAPVLGYLVVGLLLGCAGCTEEMEDAERFGPPFNPGAAAARFVRMTVVWPLAVFHRAR